jgi:hypothetical protein
MYVLYICTYYIDIDSQIAAGLHCDEHEFSLSGSQSTPPAPAGVDDPSTSAHAAASPHSPTNDVVPVDSSTADHDAEDDESTQVVAPIIVARPPAGVVVEPSQPPAALPTSAAANDDSSSVTTDDDAASVARGLFALHLASPAAGDAGASSGSGSSSHVIVALPSIAAPTSGVVVQHVLSPVVATPATLAAGRPATPAGHIISDDDDRDDDVTRNKKNIKKKRIITDDNDSNANKPPPPTTTGAAAASPAPPSSSSSLSTSSTVRVNKHKFKGIGAGVVAILGRLPGTKAPRPYNVATPVASSSSDDDDNENENKNDTDDEEDENTNTTNHDHEIKITLKTRKYTIHPHIIYISSTMHAPDAELFLYS